MWQLDNITFFLLLFMFLLINLNSILHLRHYLTCYNNVYTLVWTIITDKSLWMPMVVSYIPTGQTVHSAYVLEFWVTTTLPILQNSNKSAGRYHVPIWRIADQIMHVALQHVAHVFLSREPYDWLLTYDFLLCNISMRS